MDISLTNAKVHEWREYNSAKQVEYNMLELTFHLIAPEHSLSTVRFVLKCDGICQSISHPLST
jgi:hypothetical protein